jgi:hypothetical protein
VLFEVPVHRLVFFSNDFASTHFITAAAGDQKTCPPGDNLWAPVVLDVDVENFQRFMKVIP